MYNAFISVIGIIKGDKSTILNYINSTYNDLSSNFSDFEIILINNHFTDNLDSVWESLSLDVKKSILIVNLSKTVDMSIAVVSGLDNSNGDYTVTLDMDLNIDSGIITKLYKKTQENYDIIYLRYKNRKIQFFKKILYNIIYSLIRKYSEIDINIYMHHNNIISRRALNSLLQIREKMRFTKAVYSSVGYNTSSLEVEISEETSLSFSEQVNSAMILLTSYSNILNKISLGLLILSLFFCLGIVVNAITVKYFSINIFGYPAVYVQGWTFLVIMNTIMFSILNIIFYVISLYLINIYTEVKSRPMYFIESIQKV